MRRPPPVNAMLRIAMIPPPAGEGSLRRRIFCVELAGFKPCQVHHIVPTDEHRNDGPEKCEIFETASSIAEIQVMQSEDSAEHGKQDRRGLAAARNPR